VAKQLIVERLREASERTQFLITTHSAVLTDRLKPEELIAFARADDGSSVILTEHIPQPRRHQ
jgi:predicted ATPase